MKLCDHLRDAGGKRSFLFLLGLPSLENMNRGLIGEGNGNPLQCSCLENPTEVPGGSQSMGSESDMTERLNKGKS